MSGDTIGAFTEYGSEFWLDDSPDDFGAGSLPFGDEAVYLNSGREALYLLLQGLKGRYTEAILPAYSCQSVHAAFCDAGIAVRFYDLDDAMTTTVAQIPVSAYGKYTIFVHMGYFGMPVNQSLEPLLPALSERGCLIVEDITHSLFNTGYRPFSHIQFASIRKWLGIPGGGVLLPGGMDDFPPPSECFDAYHRERRAAMRLKAEYIHTGHTPCKKEYMHRFAASKKLLDGNTRAHTMDAVSLGRLAALNPESFRRHRRENYTAFARSLSSNSPFHAIFPELPADVCPLFFPTYVKGDNRAMQALLAQAGIYCAIHWPASRYLDSEYPGRTFIERHILSFPCDQRYTPDDMVRMAERSRKVVAAYP